MTGAHREHCEDDQARKPGDGGDEAGEERRATHQVHELDRADREIGPLDQVADTLPAPEVPERPFGGPEEPRGEREPLAAVRLLSDPRLRGPNVWIEPVREPGALLRSEREEPRDEDEETDCASEDERAPAALEHALGEQRRGLCVVRRRREARNDERSLDRLVAGAGGLDGEMVAGPRRRDVADLPRALELLGDRCVNLGQGLARGRAVVGAAGLLGELLQRRRREERALDRNRVDGDARILRGAGCVGQRRLAHGLVAVRHEDDHAGRQGLSRERASRQDDCVPERRALDRVDREGPKRRVGVDRGRREARQRNRLRRKRRDRDPVGGGLRFDEGACRGGCVGKWLAAHRPRAIDHEHDALRPPEVLGRDPCRCLPVLGELRRADGRSIRDDADLDGRIRARVDGLHLHARRGERRQEESGERREKDPSAHQWNDPKLAAANAGR